MRDLSVRLFDFLDAMADAVLLVDEQGLLAHMNASFTRLLGYEPGALLGQPLSTLIPARLQARHAEHFDLFRREGRAAEMTEAPLLFMVTRRGGELPVSISLSPLVLGGQRCTIAFVRDASRLHQYLGEVTAQAETDALTGLTNRRAALASLERLVQRGEPFALLFLDLVGFKRFNDLHGHHVGDEVLSAVAKRLRASVRVPDVPARFGGDEFLALVNGLKDPALLEARARSMSARIEQPMHVDSLDLRPGVTIGAALFPLHGATAELLLQSADQAMYQAKRAGLSYCLSGAAPVRFEASGT